MDDYNGNIVSILSNQPNQDFGNIWVPFLTFLKKSICMCLETRRGVFNTCFLALAVPPTIEQYELVSILISHKQSSRTSV